MVHGFRPSNLISLDFNPFAKSVDLRSTSLSFSAPAVSPKRLEAARLSELELLLSIFWVPASVFVLAEAGAPEPLETDLCSCEQGPTIEPKKGVYTEYKWKKNFEEQTVLKKKRKSEIVHFSAIFSPKNASF